MLSKDSPYYHQVALLISILPLVGEENCFALKGGTAINLFVRDMPRLSVDIDLTYLPIEDRQPSLTAITSALSRIGGRIAKILKGTTVDELKDKQDNVLKLLVARQGVQVKIEVSPVLRGSLFKPVAMDISKTIGMEFPYTRMKLLHQNELYAGKICAAIDRQDPRDLFDVKILFDNEGITNELMKVFVVYLISGNRPLAEMLDPHHIPLEATFNEQFVGMELIKISLQDLETTRMRLIREINNKMTDKQKQFLLSFKAVQPEWNLLDMGDVANLPAVQWKLLNIKRMPNEKHKAALDKLKKVLYG